MDQWQESYLAIAEGNVKVEIRDLVKLFEEIEKMSDMPQEDGTGDFIKYFKNKYLELTYLRIMEKQTYEHYKKVKEIAKREDYPKVKEFENNYNRIRNERMKVQAETNKEKKKYYLY